MSNSVSFVFKAVQIGQALNTCAFNTRTFSKNDVGVPISKHPLMISSRKFSDMKLHGRTPNIPGVRNPVKCDEDCVLCMVPNDKNPTHLKFLQQCPSPTASSLPDADKHFGAKRD